ncbi:MAG TPA: site-2 protease family protein [Campylobacterales bacterium]|nr:site-2 protease family protein [Campylobacterales bacterium]
MFSTENILLIIVIAIVIFNFKTIFGALFLYFMKLRDIDISIIKREEVSIEVQEIIKPYEELLLNKGFVYKSAIEYNSIVQMFQEQQHTFYYYHEEKGVHASIATMPFQGALEAVTLDYSTFYESYHIATTYDCFKYNLPKIESVTAFDHYHGSFEKAFESHLEDRLLEGESIRYEALTPEGLVDYMEFQTRESLDALKEHNIMKQTNSGLKYSFSFAFIKYVHTTLKGHKFASKVLARQNVNTTDNKQANATAFKFKSSEEVALAQGLNHKPKEQDKNSKIRTFIISGLAFVLFFGLIGIPFSVLPMLLVILLIHELGHFYAMKFFGYKDTSIFFIPLFGAAAKGEKEDVTAFQEFIVSLAGPLPGMLISVTIGVGIFMNPSVFDNALLKEYAIMSFALNYLNLLPVFPLDGGKIVQTLLFSRYPKAQFYFFLVSLLIIIFSALLLESIILGVFSLLLFLAINHNHHTSTLIGKVLNSQEDKELNDKAIEILVHDERYKEIPFEKKGAMLKQALKVLKAEKPSFLVMLLGMGLYLLLLLPPFWVYFFVLGQV